METLSTIEFTRINNDVNGNPRFVCHFLAFVNEKDREKADKLQDTVKPFKFSVSHLYDIALAKSRQLGGKKFHNNQYGGGIVFQMYSGEQAEMTARINEIKNQ